MLCASVLFFVACEKESETRDNYKIEFESTKVVLDNQGTGSISCVVTPTDLDISTIKDLEFSDYKLSCDDAKMKSIAIVSATKDSKTPGKWNIALALSSWDETPYTPNPKYYYHLAATANAFIKISAGNLKVSSNNFDVVLDLNAAQ